MAILKIEKEMTKSNGTGVNEKQKEIFRLTLPSLSRLIISTMDDGKNETTEKSEKLQHSSVMKTRERRRKQK